MAIQSPSYPSMSLADAIDAVGKIEAVYRSSPVDREDGARLIGYSSLSGPANKALAALASYGLVERAGKGMMRVTPLARSILHPKNEIEKRNSLMEAANTPPLFQQIREQFDDHIVPPESGVTNFLNRAGFNPSAVPRAARAFLETARLVEELSKTESQRSQQNEHAEAGSASETNRFGDAAVGDLIQWESQGVLQFKEPRRVRWVSGDGTYLAVEGSTTGIPMDEVIVEAKAPQHRQRYDVPPEEEGPEKLNKIKTIFEDDTVRISAWLDRNGVRELERRLKAIKMMLNMDDEGRDHGGGQSGDSVTTQERNSA